MESFLKPESHGIDDGKEAVHGGFINQFEERMHFGHGENRWDFLFDLDTNELESLPISGACQSKELLEGLVGDVDGGGFPQLGLRDVEEVTPQILFGGRVGIGAEEFGELSEHADIGLLSAFPFAVNLEIVLEPDGDRSVGL
jgi:hypothetical protein